MTLLCVHGTFFKLAAQPQDFCQLPSTLRASAGPSINFLCVRGTVCQRPSTFCVCVGPSKKGSCSRGSSINFPCNHGTFRQLSMRPWDLPSTSRMSVGHSMNYRQLSVHPRDDPSTFRMSAGHSMNYRQLCRASEGPSVSFPCVHGTFHQLSICPQDIP